MNYAQAWQQPMQICHLSDLYNLGKTPNLFKKLLFVLF